MIGLANAAALRLATPCSGHRSALPTDPQLLPEHFAVARGTDPSKAQKQFRKGIEQLQSRRASCRCCVRIAGDQAPVLAAVGPMQFEVASHRMATEFNAPDRAGVAALHRRAPIDPTDASSCRSRCRWRLTGTDGVLLALFTTKWRLQGSPRTTRRCG